MKVYVRASRNGIFEGRGRLFYVGSVQLSAHSWCLINVI